ncbi:hypothetical protein [Streptomyces spectabilis]|uniref:Uncharacterized protein n=1 Tax=Streptomyces spectabilis TaxID=68270 RepID=A0A516RF77_STRST|nr:hypothetical protein [Streptomyces spectabilis]QDQ14309.1 hypothetical protein FH965_30150 [Streptomyces spectabilis]
MAFYLVTDGRSNEFGESDTFVVRAGGKRQAVQLAPVANAKDAEVTRLDDGRDVPHAVILSSLVDFTGDTDSASAVVGEVETEGSEITPATPIAATGPGYAVI